MLWFVDHVTPEQTPDSDFVRGLMCVRVLGDLLTGWL